MEIITKKNIRYLSIILVSILVIFFSYLYYENSKTNKKQLYFDLYLSNIYNDLSDDSKEYNLELLSSLNDSNINFFANLKKPSIEKLSQYEELEKSLILLKHSIKNKNNIEIDYFIKNNLFVQTATINYLSQNFNNIKNINLDKLDPENFYLNAVNLYLNDN